YDHFFTDEDLWKMVTSAAAVATGTDDVLGRLEAGQVADIAVFDGQKHADYRAVLAAEPDDVVLVLRGGKPLYGDAALVSSLGATGCDPLDVCGRGKSVCVMSEVGKTLDALRTAAGSAYGLFFCGTPDGEPTCVPSRRASVAGSTVYTGQPSAAD